MIQSFFFRLFEQKTIADKDQKFEIQQKQLETLQKMNKHLETEVENLQKGGLFKKKQNFFIFCVWF